MERIWKMKKQSQEEKDKVWRKIKKRQNGQEWRQSADWSRKETPDIEISENSMEKRNSKRKECTEACMQETDE